MDPEGRWCQHCDAWAGRGHTGLRRAASREKSLAKKKVTAAYNWYKNDSNAGSAEVPTRSRPSARDDSDKEVESVLPPTGGPGPGADQFRLERSDIKFKSSLVTTATPAPHCPMMDLCSMIWNLVRLRYRSHTLRSTYMPLMPLKFCILTNLTSVQGPILDFDI